MTKQEYLQMLLQLVENINRVAASTKVFPTSPEGTADAIIDPHYFNAMINHADYVFAELCKD